MNFNVFFFESTRQFSAFTNLRAFIGHETSRELRWDRERMLSVERALSKDGDAFQTKSRKFPAEIELMKSNEPVDFSKSSSARKFDERSFLCEETSLAAFS